MKTGYDNRQMKTDTEVKGNEYHFPAHGITVVASSFEEAKEKLQELLKHK